MALLISDEQVKTITTVLVSVSGWVAACVAFLFKIREERRKTNEEERKRAAEKARIGERLAPFITTLNKDEYVHYYVQIANGNLQGEDPWELRKYPAELEQIGALMMSDIVPASAVYKNFGEQILTCASASFLWDNENMGYWKVFQTMVEAMRQEQAKSASH